jgi:hypothetical protein
MSPSGSWAPPFRQERIDGRSVTVIENVDGVLVGRSSYRRRKTVAGAGFVAAAVSPLQSEFARTASRFDRALVELRVAVNERIEAEYAAGAATWAEIGDDDLREAFHETRALVAASKAADREQ